MSFNIENSIGFSLHHSSYIFKSAIKHTFKQAGYDVTPEEFVALNLIGSDGIEQGELVKRSLKDKTNITRLLDRLQKKSLILRQEHHTSGRQQFVVLTPKGQALCQTLLPLVQSMVSKATQGLSQEELETARQVLNKISHNLHD